MPEGVASRDLIGPGRVQEVAGEGALLGAVDVTSVVHGERVPARAPVQAPADVRDRVGLAIAPGSEILAHQVSVEACTFDACHVVRFDREPYRRLEVALEGEVEV